MSDWWFICDGMATVSSFNPDACEVTDKEDGFKGLDNAIVVVVGIAGFTISFLFPLRFSPFPDILSRFAFLRFAFVNHCLFLSFSVLTRSPFTKASSFRYFVCGFMVFFRRGLDTSKEFIFRVPCYFS